MEENALSARLDDSRQSLRKLLLPDQPPERDGVSGFPRSAVLKLLLAPGLRPVVLTVLPTLLNWVRRRRHGK